MCPVHPSVLLSCREKTAKSYKSFWPSERVSRAKISALGSLKRFPKMIMRFWQLVSYLHNFISNKTKNKYLSFLL
jgi:hypothetical protein